MYITHPNITNYVENLVATRDELLQRLEAEGEAEGIPNIQISSMDFIMTLLTAYPRKRILEIGTAIGYSGISMLKASPGSYMVTIERDEARYIRAIDNFREANLADRVNLKFGDALEIIPSLNETFDFVFIDAAKGQYMTFLEQIIPQVTIGGIIVTDNTMFRGFVASDEQIPAKYVNIVEKIKRYNERLSLHEQLKTSHIPIGDGLALSVKVR